MFVATTPRRLRTAALIAAVAVLTFLPSRPASAKTLEKAMQGLATSVQSYLAAKREPGVIVRNFDGPSGSSSSSKMKKALCEELKKLNVPMPKVNALQLDGNVTRDTIDGKAIVEITLTMRDRNNNAVQQFNDLALEDRQATVDNVEEVAALEGATAGQSVVNPTGTAAAANAGNPAGIAGNPPAGAADPAAANVVAGAAGKAIAQAIEKPAFITTNDAKSIVAPDKTTPYRIEILACAQGSKSHAPRPVSSEEGLAFCDIQVGEEYIIKVYNDSDYWCGVKLSIDGLSVFEFSDIPQFKALGMYAVPPKGFLPVRGWYRSQTMSETFLVTGVPNSAAGELGRITGDIGTINALFFAAWQPNEQQPPIEPIGARSAGTARGPQQQENFSTFVGFFGKTLQSSISIRYVKPDPADLPPIEAVVPPK